MKVYSTLNIIYNIFLLETLLWDKSHSRFMTQGPNPSYLIYGAGALGSVLGGFLQKIGRSVTYVGRGEHFRAIQDKGLMITGIWGDHFVPPEEIDVLT